MAVHWVVLMAVWMDVMWVFLLAVLSAADWVALMEAWLAVQTAVNWVALWVETRVASMDAMKVVQMVAMMVFQ